MKAKLAAMAFLAWVATFTCGAPGAEAGAHPGAEAGKLYDAAQSQFQAGRWDEALPLLEKFVKAYSTNERIPVAYLQLAHCRRELKDVKGYNAALDQVIRRFSGSPSWFCAYASKLSDAKAKADNDGYLSLMDSMLSRLPEAPLRLNANLKRTRRNYMWQEYRLNPRIYPSEALVGMGRDVFGSSGWIMDVAWAADTPKRATRALRSLAKTFKRLKHDLPPDWQYAHVLLLRQAGKAEKAEKTWADYIGGWGEDPRGAKLWLLRAANSRSHDDDEDASAAYEHLIKNYPGYNCLQGPLAGRLNYLYEKNRYEDFVKLARHWLKHYGQTQGRDTVLKWWIALAGRAGKAKEGEKPPQHRIHEALKMLDEFPAGNNYPRRRIQLKWRIALAIQLGDFDRAAEQAGQLIREEHWSDDSYRHIRWLAERHKQMEKVLAAARAKWAIPVADPNSPAAGKLKELKSRLKDDQHRHADEIADEMYQAHRSDASTIEAVKAMADYYFRKLMPKPRDKWMDRMIEAYPYHPLTEAVLWSRTSAQTAARQYKQLAATLDTLMSRFPGAAKSWRWYSMRRACHMAGKDREAVVRLAESFFGPAAGDGDIGSINRLIDAYEDLHGWSNKATGDAWADLAKRVPSGSRAELYCLKGAWNIYFVVQFFPHRRGNIQYAATEPIVAALRKHTVDPQVRWQLEFADVNFLAMSDRVKQALDALNTRLEGGRKYRDLSLRLDMWRLGEAMGKAELFREGESLAGKLRKACFTRRDARAVEMFLAGLYAGGEMHARAAQHYLKVVYDHPEPARMYTVFDTALGHLEKARSPQLAVEIKRYVRAISNVQELVPGLLLRAWRYCVWLKNPAAASVRNTLRSRYPHSGATQKLDQIVRQRLQSERDKRRNK